MSASGRPQPLPLGAVPRIGAPPPALTATPQAQAIRALAGMQQQLIQAVTQMLQAYEPPRMRCWPCFVRRHAWNTAHAAELEQARADASGSVPDGFDGAIVPFDILIRHLPEPLRPDPSNPAALGTDRMPAPLAATMTLGGTGYCDADGELAAGEVLAKQAGRTGDAESVAAAASTSSAAAATSADRD